MRAPEIVILRGTLRGLTYERMAEGSEYSTNYLMRDVAPKLWKQLSSIFGCSVGKTNFRVVLDDYAERTFGDGLASSPSVLSSSPNVHPGPRLNSSHRPDSLRLSNLAMSPLFDRGYEEEF